MAPTHEALRDAGARRGAARAPLPDAGADFGADAGAA